MTALLRVLAGPDKDHVFRLEGTPPLRIGRGRDAHIQINDATVSRAHCELVVLNDRFALADTGSRSGTFVNGTKIEKRVLQPGDVVQIGATQFRFELGADAEEPTLMAEPGAARPAIDISGYPTQALSKPVVRKVKPAPGQQPVQLRREQMHELAGTQLSHYWVGDVIAAGRTGLVFFAEDTRQPRSVALKVLWPDFVREPAEVKRLIRSMHTMLPLGHPHLVRIYSAGRTGPYCWIAMEYVPGESAAGPVARVAAGEAPDWHLALRVGLHVSRALVFAHHHRIIHRNITPSNILISSADQKAKLGDLMLAKALEGTLTQPLTAPGTILGDVAYLPPERISASAGAADERSDFYGLGATLYALLTGRPPLVGNTVMEILVKVWQEQPPPPLALQPGLPLELNNVVVKMLAKNPAHRHQKAVELMVELDALARSLGVAV